MKTRLTIVTSLATVMGFISCSSDHETAIDYPDKTLPAEVAALFAPGIVSTNKNEHSPMTFSPDGSVALWATMDINYHGRLFEIKYENGTWSAPQSPSFADTTSDDFCPSFTPDGNTLFFSSRRDAQGYAKGRGNRIWSVDRTANGWGTPVPFDSTVSKAQEFAHSTTEKGTIYFSAIVDGDMNILRSERTNTGYTKPEVLPNGINSEGYEDGPFIAPDESFLIFESTRAEGIEGSHDLYISFRDDAGKWTSPRNLGVAINSGAMERFPRLSPDGKFFFFASNRDQSDGKVGFDFYWIDAGVIEGLRTR